MNNKVITLWSWPNNNNNHSMPLMGAVDHKSDASLPPIPYALPSNINLQTPEGYQHGYDQSAVLLFIIMPIIIDQQ